VLSYCSEEGARPPQGGRKVGRCDRKKKLRRGSSGDEWTKIPEHVVS